MYIVTWNDIKDILHEELKTILRNQDYYYLSDYDKRVLVFEHLTNTLKYDFDKLDGIKNKTVARDGQDELFDVIYAKRGICNAISQYYKLILERLGIPCYCVTLDDGTDVRHQVNLVYDTETETFSFDDVTSVIVGRGTIDEYLGYDIEMAHKYNQGLKKVFRDSYFVVMPEVVLSNLVERDKSPVPDLNYFPENRIQKLNKNKIK